MRELVEHGLRESTEPAGDSGLPPTLAELLLAWVADHPDDARSLLEIEPLPTKPPQVLDDMRLHIRYEVLRLVAFMGVGNAWVLNRPGLPPDWGEFAAESMLEAALIHARCVAEFLRPGRPDEKTIHARDYLPDWHWKAGEPLKGDIAEIHGRVAHLGVIRRSVQHVGEDFSWKEFLDRSAVPILLDGFREFLGRLGVERAEQFNKPTTDTERVDLVAMITATIGPPAAA